MAIVSRADWGAKKPRKKSNIYTAQLPTLHYVGANVVKASTLEEEKSFLRGIQRFHMQTRGWFDIAYNFAVGLSGNVYELRGLGVRSAANGKTKANKESYAVLLLVGGSQVPSDEMISSTKNLLKVVGGDDYQGHRDHKATACPGDVVYGLLEAGAFKAGSSVPKLSNKSVSSLPMLGLGDVEYVEDDI